MDIAAVNRSTQTAPVNATAPPVDNTARNRELVQAVKALNESEMFGSDRQLRFQKDPHTGKMVVKVVNRKTDEVVSQIPPEYVLSLAQDWK